MERIFLWVTRWDPRETQTVFGRKIWIKKEVKKIHSIKGKGRDGKGREGKIEKKQYLHQI